jgi:hypothetical protein
MVSIHFAEPQTGTIKIMDMSGKCIMESGINNAKDEQISLNTFPKGIYFVKINDLTKKMIVE